MRSVSATKPSSVRIVCHASVRMRYVTKNGAITSRSRRFFQRPPRKAMKYASGYEITSAAIVATAAYFSERMEVLVVGRIASA